MQQQRNSIQVILAISVKNTGSSKIDITNKNIEVLTVKLYMGKFVTQYKKSANARFKMNMVVYFDAGVLLKPNIFFLRAHGIARRVSILPEAPNVATIMHLNMYTIIRYFQ